MRRERQARRVLYDECSATERSAVEAHLARCVVCSSELEGLKDVRTHLAGWNAPRTDLGFRITREPVPPVASHRTWTLPAWVQAAAAVLVLAAGAGLANLQIEYGSGGVTLRTGWANARQAVAATAGRAAPPLATAEQLRELEQRMRAALAATQSAGAAPATSPAGTSAPRTDRGRLPRCGAAGARDPRRQRGTSAQGICVPARTGGPRPGEPAQRRSRENRSEPSAARRGHGRAGAGSARDDELPEARVVVSAPVTCCGRRR